MHPSGAQDLFITVREFRVCWCETDDRTDLSFTTAAGPHQRSHSQGRVPRNSWQYFTASGLRLSQPGDQVPIFISPSNWVPFLSPPTTRRATVEVLEPTSLWSPARQVLPLLLYNVTLLVQINTEIISKELLDRKVNHLSLQSEQGQCSDQLSARCMWLAVTTLSESAWGAISLLKILQQPCSVLSLLCCNIGQHWKMLQRNLLPHSGWAYFDDKCRLFRNVGSFF
jgi:hypothetical protein